MPDQNLDLKPTPPIPRKKILHQATFLSYIVLNEYTAIYLTLTDKHIIKKSVDGDPSAQRQLYERYRSYWYSLSLRYGKNAFEANDILQEGLIRIYNDLHKYKEGNFKAWSGKVLVNSALRYQQKQSWYKIMTDIDDVPEESVEDMTALEMMSTKEIIALVQKLPIGYRLVFNMYAIEGYSHKEIAEELGISVGTSKSQLHKARKAIQEALEFYFYN